MLVDPSLYRKAFQAYLRKGTPIEWSIKQERPTTHYIWRTRGDDKVRPSHAANNGRIFAWDDPPPTGHPGEDYGCRCTAEPYRPEISEYMEISTNGIGTKAAWGSDDYVDHYFNGRGRGVSLSEIGHLDRIASWFMDRRGEALKIQIAKAARDVRNGPVSYDFENSYDLTGVVFSVGDTTTGGVFEGQCSKAYGILELHGELDFSLTDRFEAPLDIGVEVIDIPRTVDAYFRDRADQAIQNRLLQRKDRVRYGTPYDITGNWSGRLRGRIYFDPARSKY